MTQSPPQPLTPGVLNPRSCSSPKSPLVLLVMLVMGEVEYPPFELLIVGRLNADGVMSRGAGEEACTGVAEKNRAGVRGLSIGVVQHAATKGADRRGGLVGVGAGTVLVLALASVVAVAHACPAFGKGRTGLLGAHT